MRDAAADLRSKQKDDLFEIIPRPRTSEDGVQEWRIRCTDCPGKVNFQKQKQKSLNLGPGLTNFFFYFFLKAVQPWTGTDVG